MTLATGTRLGPYEITGSLGAGGMGEVYKARDTRLDRTVAIKVLPELLASDSTFRARFDREARAISSLNHPHICTLHDVGAEGPTAFLVMEHVDGQPLAGPVPVERAIAIAIQICDALEAAHRTGIVHRDLKPSNILISRSHPPQVKLLDFGLATRSDAHAKHTTDATISALTGEHKIVGTPQYMAPEQIEGREADTRTDIFALGCVLYELVTGKRAFAGDSPSAVMSAILATEPRSMREFVPITPLMLEWIVMRCLAKNPDDRWQTVRDLRAALERVRQEPAAGGGQPLRVARLPWIAAALAALLAIAAAAWAVAIMRRAPARDARIFMSEFVAPTTPNGPPALRLSISPDGRRLAYPAPDSSGRISLWVHSLDTLSTQPLPGTVNATAPFWSPDSGRIAFIAEGKLKKIDLSNGDVTTICEATTGPPGTWNKDDVILFTGSTSVITRVRASGGTPTPVLSFDDKLGPHLQIAPAFLPDGRHFVYVSAVPGGGSRGLFLASLDSPDPRSLLPSAVSNARYANGHLLFVRGSTLIAQPFDADSLKLFGDPVPIAEQLQVNPTSGTAAFTVSENGVLVYQTSTGGGGTTLAWFDRSGRRISTLADRSGYLDVELSHASNRASVSKAGAGGDTMDIYVYDVARKFPTQITFGPEKSSGAIWTTGDRQLIYSAQREMGSALMTKAANGGTAEVLLEDKAHIMFPLSVSPDGRFLLYNEVTRALQGKIGVLPLTGERKPYLLLNSGFSEIPAQFSADGKWIAYVSDRSDGRKEVFATLFSKPTTVIPVSSTGGDFPRWSRDGKELFFLGPDKLMVASISIQGDELKVQDVKPLFDVRWPLVTRSVYDVAPDGQRFLMNIWEATAALPFTIVVNWTEKLRR